MKTLMIHEVHPWMLELDLSEFDVLTFDDGLYSQYKNYKHFLKFNKPMYFFICTGSICPDETYQNNKVISCDDAHELFFNYSDRTNYMKWSQINEILKNPMCKIGGHSHSHPYLRNAGLETQLRITCRDIIEMNKEFNDRGITINSFCYPYNYEATGWKYYAEMYGVTEFFGSERTPIEDLK